MSAITISAEERAALYEQIDVRLSGIGDIWLAASTKDFGKAEELARAYSDDLRLLLDDLGWGDGSGAPVELTTPPEVLRRVFGRLREAAEAQEGLAGRELEKARAERDHNRFVIETCDSLLARLDGGGVG